MGGARDASWAETPQEKLLRLSAAASAGPAALAGPQGDGGATADGGAAAAAAGAVDAYNSGHRAKTLLQKHQERLQVCCELGYRKLRLANNLLAWPDLGKCEHFIVSR